MKFKDHINAKDCYARLALDDSKSYIIDVRSKEELISEGVVDLSESPEKVVFCEWHVHGSMELNEHFFKNLIDKLDFSQINQLYFICAAGVRSKEAANYTRNKLKALDFKIECINVADGFTGNKNYFFGFGEVNGWKAMGLPYRQFEKTSLDS